jgi:glycosyltransferase involved in cell wall biosynthesis
MLAKPSARDLAYKVFGSKKFLGHSGIHYVGCSHWIADCARHSALLGSADITAVPNPIDTDIFSPADKAAARQRFDLPVNKKLILFAAVNLSDLRKGILYFIEACRHLSPQNVEVAFMGGSIGGDLQRAMPVPSRALGYLHGAKDIAEAYSAADVFVTASLSENLPNTVMEAMSCGTPCVGFNVGGIPEMIDHQENGYVAKYMDTHDLAHGIQWLLYQSDYDKLCKNARIKAQTSYSESIVAAQYVNLYQKLLLK